MSLATITTTMLLVIVVCVGALSATTAVAISNYFLFSKVAWDSRLA